MESSEGEKLIKEDKSELKNAVPVTYRQRWYIAFVFGSLACLQSALTVVWLVVADSTEAAYGWSNAELSFMQIWVYATFLVGMAPFAWLMQNKGMRVCTLISATLIFMSTVCRMITSSTPYVTWLAHLGHMFNGISAPVLFCGSPVMSATWFPPRQRATATAIITTYSLSGTALIFLVDPYLVPAPMYTSFPNQTVDMTDFQNITNISNIRNSLMNLRYLEFGIASLLLVMTLVYFPAKPPEAPSISATVDNISFTPALQQIFSRRKANFWYVSIPSSISAGLYGVFTSMLDVNLKTVGVSQKTAGWLSFCGTVGSTLAGLVIGRLGDRCVGRRKAILLVTLVSASLGALFFALLVGQYIPFNIVGLYVSYLVLGASVNGALPLYYEASIETTFPISEGVTMGVITTTYNILPIAFLMVPLIPDIGTEWMNWFIFGALSLCIPLLIIYKERYDRLSLDEKEVCDK